MQATGTTGRSRWLRALSTRCLLLGALVVGILGMHVLTGGDATDHAQAMPTAATPSAAAPGQPPMTHGAATIRHAPSPAAAVMRHTPSPAAAVPATDPPAPMGDHAAMAGCILFIVLGAVLGLLILALLARLGRTDDRRSVRSAPHAQWRRGPPQWPALRRTLCVDRI